MFNCYFNIAHILLKRISITRPTSGFVMSWEQQDSLECDYTLLTIDNECYYEPQEPLTRTVLAMIPSFNLQAIKPRVGKRFLQPSQFTINIGMSIHPIINGAFPCPPYLQFCIWLRRLYKELCRSLANRDGISAASLSAIAD